MSRLIIFLGYIWFSSSVIYGYISVLSLSHSLSKTQVSLDASSIKSSGLTRNDPHDLMPLELTKVGLPSNNMLVKTDLFHREDASGVLLVESSKSEPPKSTKVSQHTHLTSGDDNNAVQIESAKHQTHWLIKDSQMFAYPDPMGLDQDWDNDLIPNIYDNDADNDGITNAFDLDDDNDGIINFIDFDADNDGISNFFDNDHDNDGLIDILDNDFDNDGIEDR